METIFFVIMINFDEISVFLSCEKLLESILGPALFAQFCVSGVVLCTSAYQLTVVNRVKITFFLPISIQITAVFLRTIG